MAQNTIVINGKHYDALSGKLLHNQHSKTPTSATKLPTSGQALDGFMKRPKSVTPRPTTPSHAVHHKTSHSKTLMRHAVKKPAAKVSTLHNKNYSIYQPPSTRALRTSREAYIDRPRAGRAAQVHRSSQVSKFGDTGNHVTKSIAPIPVKPAPDHHKMALHNVSAPIDLHNIPADMLEKSSPFDSALKQADAHKLPRTKRPSLRQRTARKLRISPHALSLATGVFIMLFVGGLIAYRNVPQLALKIASTRAGVRAQLPSYQPSGFSLNGPVQYTNGVVTLNYESNSDDRNFRVVQKNSDWNSQSLADNFTAAKDTYQTFEDKGRTIFVYDGNNATWVNGGVLYQVEGDASLSSDQLRRIISGL